MILHESHDEFKELIELTAEYFNLSQSIVEKDYWVTKSLHNLSNSDMKELAIFKGGTSLTKCYKNLYRFSEDIDIAIITEGLNPNQTKKRLKKVENVMKGDLIEVDQPGYTEKKGIVRRTQFEFVSCFNDELEEMHPHIRFEIIAFSRPTPIEECMINSMIYEYLISQKLEDVISEYQLDLFPLTVLKIERTILEKIVSLVRMSYEPGWLELSRKTRHLYDIYLTFDILKDFYYESNYLIDMVKVVKVAEEESSMSKSYPYQESWYKCPLIEALENHAVEEGYTSSFGKEFVFGKLPDYKEVKKIIRILFDIFRSHDI